ncbi:MAG: hypothetical protein AB8H79_09210, partial [Myxococcota bacterium]
MSATRSFAPLLQSRCLPWFALSLSLAAPALAQDSTSTAETTAEQNDNDDLEYKKSTNPLKKKIKGLQTRFTFDLEWHETNNLDFRALDESDDQAILDSDDRSGFAFSGMGAQLDYEVDDDVELTVGVNHRGLWGTDQLGGTNTFGGWIYFTSFFVDYHPWGEDGVHLRMGRQPFEIGNLAGTRDYVLADINDMIRVDVPIKGFGRLTLIPVDVVASTPNTDGITFAGYLSQSTSSPWNFRGKTRSTRHGATLTLEREGLPVQATAYGFFTAVGAGGARRNGTPGTGADISYAGELGNFADNDWVMNAGVRAQAEAGPVKVYGQFEASTGQDRKEEVVYDVNTTGFAWGAGVVLPADANDGGVTARLTYFESLGAAYAADGLQYSHGYVGMKGRHIDGLIANRYLGLHPTNYLGWSGVTMDMHSPQRKGGTRVIQGKIGYEGLGPVTILANGVFMQDTGYTELDFDRVDVIDAPYGY